MLDDDMCSSREFQREYAEQLFESRNSIFNDICKRIGVFSYEKVRFDLLNKRSIPREQLAEWLETVCCLMSQYCSPLLAAACDSSNVVSKLKDEKIADAAKIIELQEKLLSKQEEDMMKITELQDKLVEKKDNEMGTMKSAAEKEIKMFSSLMKNTCKNAFAPKKIQAAVKRVAVEEDRGKNLMIFGLPETDENLEAIVSGILSNHLNEKPKIISCELVGRDATERVKPVKLTFSSQDQARIILSKSKLLRTVEGFNSIYISPDRTLGERTAYKKIVYQLLSKRTAEPGKVHVIKNFRIVSFEKQP